MAAPAPDRFVHPKYRIRRDLALGSYTVLYEAVPIEPGLANHAVTLKVLRDRRYFGWFFGIAKSYARLLSHSRIVRIYNFGEINSRPYIASAFVNGEDLRCHIRSRRCRRTEEVVRTIRDVAATLDYVHSKGMIHGYLHPKHILLDADGVARLIGFGEYPLPDGAVYGNPLHLAPEQFSTEGEMSPRTDVYALAETAYWMLCGTHPYHSASFEAVVALKSSGTPINVCELRPDLPTLADAVLRKGMAARQENRFGSATEFAEALTDAIFGCRR